jgi:hypothetical protein
VKIKTLGMILDEEKVREKAQKKVEEEATTENLTIALTS